MTDIIDTARELMRRASWWGGSGQALPETCVDQLFAEIEQLRKIVERQHMANEALVERIGSLSSYETRVQELEASMMIIRNASEQALEHIENITLTSISDYDLTSARSAEKWLKSGLENSND